MLALLLAFALWLPSCDPLPPLGVARALPSHAVCLAALNANRDHQNRSGLYGGPVGDSGWYWALACRATDEGADTHYRRQALQELVSWLGWRAVLTGNLPPPIPPDW